MRVVAKMYLKNKIYKSYRLDGFGFRIEFLSPKNPKKIKSTMRKNASFSKETREKAERTKEYLEMKYNKMQRFRRDKKSRERNFKERLNRSNLTEAEKIVARKEFARGYVRSFVWLDSVHPFFFHFSNVFPSREWSWERRTREIKRKILLAFENDVEIAFFFSHSLPFQHHNTTTENSNESATKSNGLHRKILRVSRR